MRKSKEVITYYQYSRLINKLVCELSKYQYVNKIKYIYGIERGGFPISVHLSHYLNIDHICKEEFLPKIFNNFEDNLILIVDDICDTGKTFTELNSKYSEHKKNIIFASLYYKPHSSFKPTFYIQTTTNWICFPWETVRENPNREMYSHLINKKERGYIGKYLECVNKYMCSIRKEIKQLFRY